MKKVKPAEIKKILFVRLRFIGDVIISTAVVSSLQRSLPEAKLDYLAEKTPLKMLENNPFFNNLIEVEKGNILTFIKTILKIRKERYDAVIDVFGNPRSALLTLFSGAKLKIGWHIRGRSYCYNTFIERRDIIDPYVKSDCIDAYEDVLKLFGSINSERNTALYLSKAEEAFGEEFKKSNSLTGSAKIVGLQPGCRRGASLTWPKEHYAELADSLIAAGYKVLLFGGPADKETNAFVLKRMKNKPVVVETKGIREDLSIINICDCFVTNNHGPVHMAVALKVPTVGLFREDEVFLWFPYKDPKYKVLFEPASQKVDIAVEKVFAAVKELLGSVNGQLK